MTISAKDSKAELNENNSFCPSCGTEVKFEEEDTLKCESCGSTLPENTLFCPTCGTKVNQVQKVNKKNCPNCGAPTQITSAGKCEYCGSVITTGEYNWCLSNLERAQY